MTESRVEVGGKTYRITHPASASALFDEEQFEKDESMPYWADLWPSAISLARFLSNTDLSGKRAIELGCGVGLPSLIALERGAKEVVATDNYPEALDFAAHNAKVNVYREVETALLDWREPNLSGPGAFDLVLAADVLYERKNARILSELAPKLLTADGEILLADPRRPAAKLFIRKMEKKGFQNSKTTIVAQQEGREVPVILHRFQDGRAQGSRRADNVPA